MKRVLLISILGLVFFVANCQNQNGNDEEMSNVTSELLEPAQLKDILGAQPDIQLIDVRTPKEFGEGTIAHAKNVNFFDSDFEAQMTAVVDKEKAVYLFCRSGRRSANAAKKLKALGFKEVYDLKGGYLAWSEEK